MKQNKVLSSVRSQITAVNLILVAFALILALGTTLALTLRLERRSLDEKLMNAALVVARSPEVASTLARGAPSRELRDFLNDSISGVSDIDIIVVADTGGTQYYYPDPSQVGRPYAGKDQKRILAGEAPFNSNDTGLSGAERCAYAGVFAPDGSLLGFVMVGIYMRSLTRITLGIVLQYTGIALVAALLAVALSVKLSNRIKASLMGYEPDAFLSLFREREDILEALEEGVMAIDRTGHVTYLNRSAAQILNVDPKSSVGQPLHTVYPSSTLDRVMRSGKPEYNIPMLSLKHVRVLSDRMPIRQDGAIIGAVSIFRNRTEVTRLAEDLTGVRHMVEAMRAYTHEFMNKLHVILGLLQLGEYQRAEDYITDTTRIQREVVGFIMARVQEPSAAALLVGKTSRCAELGIRLTLDKTSRLSGGGTFLPPDAYVTILGNLIENAVDALNRTARGLKEITVSIQESPDELLLCVEDTGPGMAPDVLEHMFQMGYSTKGESRGTGLALVHEIVTAYQGDIRAESGPGIGTTFIIHFRRFEEGIS